MRLPIRPVQGAWPAWMERRAARFVWPDPSVILDERVSPDDFRAAMSAVQAGDTIKFTEKNRHPKVDALLLDNVDVTDAVIVDLGASDGSTSVDLISKLPPFRAFVIADLYITIDVVTVGRHHLFFDSPARCSLATGPRCIAWPSRSKFIRALYALLIHRAARSRNRRTVLLLNPATRALMAADDRVTWARHDIFEPWPGPAPDVIKVANLLGPYFDDASIARAANALLASLDEGGHLLLADHGKIAGAVGGAKRAGLYRREGGRFVAVARTETAPAIEQLVLAASVESSGNHAADLTS